MACSICTMPESVCDCAVRYPSLATATHDELALMKVVQAIADHLQPLTPEQRRVALGSVRILCGFERGEV